MIEKIDPLLRFQRLYGKTLVVSSGSFTPKQQELVNKKNFFIYIKIHVMYVCQSFFLTPFP